MHLALFYNERDRHSQRSAYPVHTALAVYCPLGDISRSLEKPSKSDVSENPSGKLVREFAIRDLALSSKQAFVLNLAKCSELARYAQGAYANPSAPGL